MYLYIDTDVWTIGSVQPHLLVTMPWRASRSALEVTKSMWNCRLTVTIADLKVAAQQSFNDHFRNLNWRYLPYIRPYKAYIRILKFPLSLWGNISWGLPPLAHFGSDQTMTQLSGLQGGDTIVAVAQLPKIAVTKHAFSLSCLGGDRSVS